MKRFGYLAAFAGKVLFLALLIAVLRPVGTSAVEAASKPAQCKAMHGFPTSIRIAPREV
jgi:hypothetical protein